MNAKKIVIAGAGEVGRYVAKKLSNDGHDVYIIDIDAENAQRASDEIDAQVITGNAARPQILAQAGIVRGGRTDLFIACTDRDEINMLSCWIAHDAGVKRVISRTRSLEFTDSPYFARKLGIDAMISPERSIAREISGLIEVNAATHAAELLGGRASLYTLKTDISSPLCGLPLKDIRRKYPDFEAVFVYVEHSDGLSGVPNGDTILRPDDTCYVVTDKKGINILQQLFNKGIRAGHSKRIFIVGGGKLGTQIALMIKRDFGGAKLRIIDRDRARCLRLSAEFGEDLVLCADGADERVLSDEGIDGADAYISAVHDDGTNILYCVMAKSMGAHKTIAVVNRSAYQSAAACVNVDAVVDPNLSLANFILKYVRYEEHALAYSMIDSINAEMLEVELDRNSLVSGKTLAQLRLRKGTVIALIGRGDEVIVPSGSTQLLAGDHVILFALTDMMSETAKLFGAEY